MSPKPTTALGTDVAWVHSLPAEHSGGWGELVATGGALWRVTPEGHREAAQAEGEDQKPPGPPGMAVAGVNTAGVQGCVPWLRGSLTPQALIRLQPQAGPDMRGGGGGA